LIQRARFCGLRPVATPVTIAQIDPSAPLAATNPPAFNKVRRPACLHLSSTLLILVCACWQLNWSIFAVAVTKPKRTLQSAQIASL
jgi:hypothetical protein